MMTPHWTIFDRFCKLLLCAIPLLLTACSTNPATGERQFAAFMSPEQEIEEGARLHRQAQKDYGFYKDPVLSQYVQSIGEKLMKDTERPEVKYKFYILDSPVPNAFAAPGGNIYVSREILALANSEAELAGVLAHEIGHVTARHSAERYSHGMVTSLGGSVIAAAMGEPGVTQALGVGSNLYITSYSRGQEGQADSLGLRYMTRAGYHPFAMPVFLNELEQDVDLQARLKGNENSSTFNYFSTHPATKERVARTMEELKNYPSGGETKRDEYLAAIDGLDYGDSEQHGFVRGNRFYHPVMGFVFEVPDGFMIQNEKKQVTAVSKNGGAIIFDIAGNSDHLSPGAYVRDHWLKNGTEFVQQFTINGLPAAGTSYDGSLNGTPVNIRVIAIEWGNKIARFQVGIPRQWNFDDLAGKSGESAFDFHRMTDAEKQRIKPYRIKIVTAAPDDTIPSMVQRMALHEMAEERFRVLNGFTRDEQVKAGQQYKIIVD